MQQKEKYLYLDGLRGILALIVVVHHFVLLFNPRFQFGSTNLSDYDNAPYTFQMLLNNTPLNIFMNGNLAVCLFLLLSGFVLSLKYFKTSDIKIIQSAFFKRYVRLAIPILGASIFIYILHQLGVFHSLFYPRNVSEFSFGKDLFLKNISLIQVFQMGLIDVPLYGNNTYLPVFWTMDIEFIGVLLLFAFLMVTHQIKHKPYLFLAFLIFLLFIGKTYYILIIAGSFIAYLQNWFTKIARYKFVFIIISILGIYMAGIPNIVDEAKKHTMYFFITGISSHVYLYFHLFSSILLFVALLQAKSIQKLLSYKPLLFLGNVSFSLYLLHLPILFIVGSFILKHFSGNFNLFLLFACCLIISVFVSYLFYKFIDVYAQKLAAKIGRLFFVD